MILGFARIKVFTCRLVIIYVLPLFLFLGCFYLEMVGPFFVACVLFLVMNLSNNKKSSD